jgi:hypothetical protein
MPKIIGMDAPTRRRVLVPVMDHTVPKEQEDVTIKERFIKDPEVHKWLFAAMVRGYLDAQQNGMDDVFAEFALTTTDSMSGMYHLSDFLEWLREADRLQAVSETERHAYGIKSKYVEHTELYTTYRNWLKVFASRYDRLEELGLKEFNSELKENHGFVEIKSGVRRWEGWRMAALSFADMSALAATIDISSN